ncbi:uncharacterized protein LOC114874123 [Osmia bicornis bicornis]|uniref:uncharacterized protein LOC114874123 n=1 Tax=Osmia bicornis bicornis TaxID=1437191 RepID=UPI0010F5FFB0|nr:uncharacterized protein LOC114874123 [Osmia bicornis bicornis]XP_029038922.1 uncharacterized protein LOC114874123 [Osmia bicornis bicornis]XP_029038924.1 uncharacterized protein LOC114874123 [Osmia bicornis bicornis]
MKNLFEKITIEKMYSVNDTLNDKRNMSNPKKENMFHSVLNVFNVLWEQVSKVPASFITNINYPLSVTVVHNEGISPEFYKNLTTKKELLNNDNVYIHNAQVKESLNIIESIHHDVCDEQKSYVDRIFNENAKDSIRFNYKCADNENKDVQKFDEKKSIMKENVIYDTPRSNYLLSFQNSDKVGKEELFECIYPNTDIHKMYDKSNDYNCENMYDTSIANNEQFSDYVSNDMDDSTFTTVETNFSPSSSNIEKIQSIPQTTTTTSNIITNMWQKVFGSVTGRFCRTDSDESDLFTKRSCSPKQRRKLNTIAKGRGRGRAKSQLRRSGVSQTRHRKERTKHDLKLDIQNDLKNWEELETYDTVEDCFNLDEDTVDGLAPTPYIIKETINPATYTFADVQLKKLPKPKTHRHVDQRSKFSTKIISIHECKNDTGTFDQDFIRNDYNFQKNTFRPRLISESSIDSEDSYCIVFETGSETYESDTEDTEDSEDEDKKSIISAQKVKFNLNPVVHVMVQWDYAYRAARKGPWEEMARDRERFRGRINCIERVLNPVLTVQHRTHIWQERFQHIE